MQERGNIDKDWNCRYLRRFRYLMSQLRNHNYSQKKTFTNSIDNKKGFIYTEFEPER